jgi:eukaryotic-like serine/threonine-protein kinase
LGREHTEPSSLSQELEAGNVIDDFEILSVMARSGMGSIFKARQRSSGRMVVLKVPHIHFESDVMFFSRFQREERIGLRLDHHAIVKAVPYHDKSRQYLVMECVEGQSLWCMMGGLGARRRIPVELAVDIGRQVCEALTYMHREGVIHRDLKPENIVIDANQRAHIIDFGIALDFSSRRLTWGRLSTRLGTPEYIAPERLRGRRGDARVDIYAIGLILYELVSGASAFVADGPRAIMLLKCKQDPRPLREVAPDLEPQVAAVIMRAIARDPSDRYATADEMLRALRDPSRAVSVLAADLSRPGQRSGTRGRPLAWPGLLFALFLALVWMAARTR